jgi:hypothetical protein
MSTLLDIVLVYETEQYQLRQRMGVFAGNVTSNEELMAGALDDSIRQRLRSNV